MITQLWDLRSTNNGGVKKIYVTIDHDGKSDKANLVYTICNKVIDKAVVLEANPKTVELDHKEQGTCAVIVEDKDSKKETRKTLNLDAAKDG